MGHRDRSASVVVHCGTGGRRSAAGGVVGFLGPKSRGIGALCGLGAAEFDDPFEFRIDRGPNNHVVFGYGPHFCLGANLARLEIDVMLNAILDRWTDIEVVVPATWTRTSRLSGLKTLPIQFTDAA